MAHQARLALLLAVSAVFTPSIFAQQESSVPAEPVVVEAPSPSDVAPNALPLGLPSDFVIGPQDIIQIEVWRDPEMSRQVAVRPDGRFNMPLIGEIQAAGLTPQRLEDTLTEALTEFLNTPEVTVSVMQVNSRSYTVAGDVKKPGSYPLIKEVTIFDAINLAGGGGDYYAKMNEVIVMRGKERLKFNYEDFVKGKNFDKNPNFLLQNGDTVLIRD